MRSENARIASKSARAGMLLTCGVVCLAATLARAGDPQPQATAAQLEPALVATYQSICAACHARAGTGAPLTGNDADWKARRIEGTEVMLARTVNGWRGMPPLGACGRCSEAELRALVVYMSGAEAAR